MYMLFGCLHSDVVHCRTPFCESRQRAVATKSGSSFQTAVGIIWRAMHISRDGRMMVGMIYV